MNRTQIIETQKRVGTPADGEWLSKSIAACQKHLRSLMPSPNPWPATDQASLTRFYGAAGDESQLVNLVPPAPVYYGGKKVRSIRCHHKVAESLHDIIADIAAGPFAYILKSYDGCYNNRPMRGGSLPSLHARGAAIDFDAANNGNRTAWPVNATMPIEIMEIFARHGWIAAGAFWGRDAMHFQATK